MEAKIINSLVCLPELLSLNLVKDNWLQSQPSIRRNLEHAVCQIWENCEEGEGLSELSKQTITLENGSMLRISGVKETMISTPKECCPKCVLNLPTLAEMRDKLEDKLKTEPYSSDIINQKRQKEAEKPEWRNSFRVEKRAIRSAAWNQSKVKSFRERAGYEQSWWSEQAMRKDNAGEKKCAEGDDIPQTTKDKRPQHTGSKWKAGRPWKQRLVSYSSQNSCSGDQDWGRDVS